MTEVAQTCAVVPVAATDCTATRSSDVVAYLEYQEDDGFCDRMVLLTRLMAPSKSRR